MKLKQLQKIILVGIFSSFFVEGFSQNCKPVNVNVVAFDIIHGKQGSVKIDYFNQDEEFKAYLIGPSGLLKKDVIDREIMGLAKGTYTLVITGRIDNDNYCIKPVEFSIK
ncbi:MAG: hypothetical protein ACKO13_11830 [Cytophagales bacterium]